MSRGVRCADTTRTSCGTPSSVSVSPMQTIGVSPAEGSGDASSGLCLRPSGDPADRADLSLDTHHYNAHTTANDALFAGLPVLTAETPSMAHSSSGEASAEWGAIT